jgi:hypothetical protein
VEEGKKQWTIFEAPEINSWVTTLRVEYQVLEG